MRRVLTMVCAASAVVLVSTMNGPSAAASPVALYNQAQGSFKDGNTDDGLRNLDELLKSTPTDADALALQAIWADFARDEKVKARALTELGKVAPDKVPGVEHVLEAIADAAATPPNPFPSLLEPTTAIVVLGFGLLPEGALRPELVSRLQTASLQAFAAPDSPIIVTGGNPQNGITEAEAMQDWLEEHGIPANRIHAEKKANSTVQNALFSTEIIDSIGADSAVLVTSANHVRRATADFTIAGTYVVAAMATVSGILGQLPPLDKEQQLGMYTDATRVFGLPANR
jgi:uncharacterized SAM-binding protein YcdF (DUF218 family)